MAFGWFSSRRGNLASVGRELPRCSNRCGDTLKAPTSVPHGLIAPTRRVLKTLSGCCNVCVCILIFSQSFFTATTAQSNFSVVGTSYNCSTNIICLGKAHVYTGNQTNAVQYGMLSLLPEGSYAAGTQTVGIAYYNEPVRLLDRTINQSASFNTSFTINNIYGILNSSFYLIAGDGMAFVISGDNSSIGDSGGSLGIFNTIGTTSFKSIVVEFDTWLNPPAPVYDISDNHVSFDFANITYAVARNCSDVNVVLSSENTVYAWVEYSRETMLLEVRISPTNFRPTNPFLSYRVDLFDVVDEYMWVGFSSGSGDDYSNFYIGDWTFESYGIESSTMSTTSGKSGVNKLPIIVGICVGIPAVLLGCVVLALLVKLGRSAGTGERGWAESTEEDSLIMQLEGMPRRFTYRQLSVATAGFSEESKLGRGGFGSVYRGVLPPSGIPVAVKKISGESTQGEKEFMAEVSIISQLRHRNLIKLMGWCKDAAKEQYLLVYDLMPNGSLDKVLFAPADSTDIRTGCLSWPKRFNIVSGTAAGIDYLHQGWTQQVVHRDIKSSNIMLDEEWNAKLGDFGLARLVDHRREAATTLVAGTYGYIAPEVAASGKFTEKSDIFAFGAVVLEVACGRKSLSSQLPEDEKILVNWVWRCLSEGDLLSAVDKRLEEYDKYRMEVLLRVGLLCSHPNPLARPSMRHVVQMLAGDNAVPSIPLSKPDPVFELRVGHGNFASDFLDSQSGLSHSNSGSISLTSRNSNDSSGPPSNGKSFGTSLSSKF